MNRLALIALLVLAAIRVDAAIFEGVEYQPPPGWTTQKVETSLGFVPDDVTPQTGIVVVLGPAEDLNQKFDSWFQQKLREELADGSKLLQASEIESQRQGDTQTATIANVVQDTAGTTTIRMYHGVTDGRKAAIAVAMGVSEEAVRKYSSSIRSFFAAMTIQKIDTDSKPGVSSSSAPAAGEERVPESSVVNGVPQGIFLGRSLLTGKAVCLLFLSNGRITRAIPAQNLDSFDWQKHQTDYPGDSGTWQLRSGQLSIRWGDGGVHEGPLQVNPTGIEFYGKTYIKPSAATLDTIAGKWEAVRGSAITGGGVVIIQTLEIDASGRFHWHTEGGSSGSYATHQNVRDMVGTLKIQRRTLIFQGDDGTVESYSFLAIPGDSLTAFTLGSNMFTRTK